MRAAGRDDSPAHFAEPEGRVSAAIRRSVPSSNSMPPAMQKPLTARDRLVDVRERPLGVILVAHLVAACQHRDGFLEVHPRREGAVAGGGQDRDPELRRPPEGRRTPSSMPSSIAAVKRVHRLGPVDRDGDLVDRGERPATRFSNIGSLSGRCNGEHRTYSLGDHRASVRAIARAPVRNFGCIRCVHWGYSNFGSVISRRRPRRACRSRARRAAVDDLRQHARTPSSISTTTGA
jgi:hypothetical protein